MSKTLMQLAQENKQAYINACNAVVGRGGTVPSGMPASELADAITNIPNDQTLAYQRVASSTSRVIVPQNAEPVAIVNKIGGMTYKSKQLLRFRDLNETQNGLTITTNADGSYTLNGTGTGNFTLWQAEEDFPHKSIGVGRTVAIRALGLEQYVYEGILNLWASSNFPEGAEYPDEYEISSGNVYQYSPSSGFWLNSIVLSITPYDSGSMPTFNNVTFTIMVNDGSTAEEYEPFFEGLRSAKVQSIKSEGANLIPYPYADGMSKTSNGITFTVNDDGSIYANGTATATTYFYIAKKVGDIASTSVNSLNSVKTIEGKTYKDCYFFDRDKNIMLQINSGVTVDRTYYPMINYGSIALPFVQGKGTLGTTTIPEDIRSLEGYGEGYNSDYYNYIEWRNGRCYFVQNCKKIVFNGTESWYAGSLGTESQYFAIEGYALPAVANGGIMNDYQATSISDSNTRIGWQLYTNKFLIRLRPANVLIDFPTLADWKSYLAERYANGNPLTFIYALNEPIETDITDLMTVDNAIIVEGGGSIKFVNEYDYDMPSETTYIINTAGG